MAFRVGQKVVCVDGSPALDSRLKLLTKGAIYVIEGFDTHPTIGVLLVGVPSGARYRDGTPAGWRRERFRPVVERKADTGMAILRSLLNTKQRENALCGNED